MKKEGKKEKRKQKGWQNEEKIERKNKKDTLMNKGNKEKYNWISKERKKEEKG